MKRKGFTLIELMVVIVVIGIITAIAVPTINRTMQNRKGLLNGKAMILNAVLGAKSRTASGMDNWQLIFDVAGSVNTISWKASDSLTVWRVDTLPRNCMLTTTPTTFEFYRDGSAQSIPPGSPDTFSIVNAKNERMLFTLIPQIGEVRVNAR